MDNFEEIYENWIDQINSTPLTTSRLHQFNDVISLNRQIINRINSIRRHIMSDDIENNDDFNSYFNDDFNDNFNIPNNTLFTQIVNPNNVNYNRTVPNVNYNRTVPNVNYNRTVPNLLSDTMITRVFDILLEAIDDNNETGNFEDVKVTLTRDQFDKLFTEILDDNNIDNYNSECNICIDEYKIGDKIVKLHCNHIFHIDCISNWLCNEKVSCPVCRKDTRENLVVV